MYPLQAGLVTGCAFGGGMFGFALSINSSALTKPTHTLIDAAILWCFTNRPRKSAMIELYNLIASFDEVDWVSQGLKPFRPLDSIIIPPGMLCSIMDDDKDFLEGETKEWYFSHGPPYRCSYLFYGPPGTGKTSTIRAMTGVLNRPACFLPLGSNAIGNNEIHEAMSMIPKPSILVIEDIDALFNKVRESKNESELTFSGLLNALDGLVAANGVITVMTTNHIKRLDPALICAGRVDRRFEFKLTDLDEIVQMFRSFYPDTKEELALKFAGSAFARNEKEAIRIATLQQYSIYSREMNAEESARLVDFFNAFNPSESIKAATE